MKKTKPTVMITIIITWALTVFLIALTFTAPWAFKWYTSLFDRLDNVYIPITIAFYLCIVPGLLACVNMLKVLYGIKRNSVFTKRNITALKIVSSCCLYVSVIFFITGFFYFPLFVFSVAAFFAGLILAVVKDAFANATHIKDENDLTI